LAKVLFDRDRGYQALLARSIALRASPVVRVGIQGAEASAPANGTDGLWDLVTLASVHEFGAADVPERSFIRNWFDENLPAIEAKFKALLLSALSGGITVKQAFEQFGLWAAAQIKIRIRHGIQPPDSPETIARKGSSVPLVDTGQLLNSVTYKVEGVS
jgi:hypothetical protein